MEVCISLVAVLIGVLALMAGAGTARDRAVMGPLVAGDERRGSRVDEQQSVWSLSRSRYRAWALGALMFVAVRAVLGLRSGWGEIVFAALGALLGEMTIRVRREEAKKKYLRRTDYHLPNVMERVVMGVSAGLDIVPALQDATLDSEDPVSEQMREVVRLAEGGMPVSDALVAVSDASQSLALKHALVHLGIAYQQGGEIVKPLKELSDATQTHFQESVDEQIARLPVKAVMPLVLTFAGLIVCFLTVPLMQVGSITRRVADVAQQQH
jgi:Flp pilus assembly protein TadB